MSFLISYVKNFLKNELKILLHLHLRLSWGPYELVGEEALERTYSRLGVGGGEQGPSVTPRSLA